MITIPEQPKNNAEQGKITSLDALQAKVEQLKERKEQSPEEQRTTVHADTLKQLIELNDTIRTDEGVQQSNPPTYELLSQSQ